MVSIVLAVFNGEKYLVKQLNSIIRQTLLPKEIIIIDDKSNDNSLKLLYEFQKKNKESFNIEIIEHKENKGYAKTFFEGIKKSKGEFVFLCDQDDIWFSNKVEVMIKIMKNNNNIECLSSKYILIDNNDKKIRDFNFRKNTKKVRKIDSKELLVGKVKPGFSVCFSNKIVEQLRKMDTDNFFAHDRLIEFLACYDDGLYECYRVLNYYRIHEKNTSGKNLGLKPRAEVRERIMQAEKEKNYLNRVLDILADSNKQFMKKKIKRECQIIINFIDKRISYLENENFYKCLLTVISNYNKYNSIQMVLGDLWFTSFLKKL